MPLPSILQGLPRPRLHEIYKKLTGGQDIDDADLDDILDGIDDETLKRAMAEAGSSGVTPEGGVKGKIQVKKQTPYKVKPMKITAQTPPAPKAPAPPSVQVSKKGKTPPAPKAVSKAPEATAETPMERQAESPAVVPVANTADFRYRPTTQDIGMLPVQQKIDVEDYYPHPDRDSDLKGFIDRPEVMRAFDTCFKMHHNLMLIGEAGSGKSTIGKYWAYRQAQAGVKIPYLAISADGLMSVNQLFGSMQIKDGTSYYVEGLFTAFTQMPSVILVDEVTSLDPTKNFVFHQILAERKFFVKEENHTFYLHQNCMIIFAGNPMNPRYPGVGKMNLAFADRMATYVLEPMSIGEIRQVFKPYVDDKRVTQGDLDKLLAYTDDVRNFIKSTASVKAEFSMRSMRRYLDFIAEGMKPRDAIELAFINTYTAFDRATYDALTNFTNNYWTK